MIIAGADGPMHLSIPLAGGRDKKQLSREVRVDESGDWRSAHIKSLRSAYSRAPFFEYHYPDLERLYRNRVGFLLDWDLGCMEFVREKLGIRVPLSVTEHYREHYDPAEWKDCRDRWLPSNYSESGDVSYRQVFEERTGFLPNLSVIDLLFCAGAMPVPKR